MSRTGAKILTLFVLAIFTITLTPSLAMARKIVIKAGHVNPPGEPAYETWNRFKKMMTERVGDRVKVKIYPQGQLGNERELIEQVKLGSIEMTAPSVAPLTLHNAHLTLFNLPYLFQSEDQLWSITDGPIGEKLAKETLEKGIMILDWWSTGVRHVFMNRPIKKASDMEGVKIRVMESPIFIEAWRGLKSQPTPLPYGEVYQALATRVADAAENDSSGYRNMRFFEVAKVFSLTAHNIIPKPVLINPAFYNKLPDDIKKVLKEVIRECTIFQRGLYANNFTADIEWLKKQGVVVVSDVDKASFQKKLLPVWAKFSDVIGDELMEETKRALGMK